MPNENLTILGKTGSVPSFQLETFPAPSHVQNIVLTCTEVTSLCEVTGQPDFATVEIGYSPDGVCLESKSLKQYLWAFREEKIFCENLAERILKDCVAVLTPSFCSVTVTQVPRGGISIKSTAYWVDSTGLTPDEDADKEEWT